MPSSGPSGLSRRFMLSGLAAMPAFAAQFEPATAAEAQTATPLASWNDGPVKQAILDFVRATTDPSSKEFVPLEERLATFDQDGTLWVEHPMYEPEIQIETAGGATNVASPRRVRPAAQGFRAGRRKPGHV